MFKLTKLFINEGAKTEVRVGQTANSNKIKVIREVDMSEVKVGDEVYVGTSFTNFIKTSPIKDIKENTNPNVLTIRTQTSTYHLEKVEE
jgi:hypothetical protein